MTFRDATPGDFATLWTWRLQDENWNDYPKRTTVDQHGKWLADRINNPLVQLLIWEEDERPRGMIRIDSNDELAYHATTDQIAARMLAAVTTECDTSGRRLKITLDQDDPKRGPLEQAGFVVYPAVFLAYKPDR